MSDILNIGIIGAGRIGKVHAATLAYRIPSARVLAIADIDLAAAQQTAGQFCIPVAVDRRRPRCWRTPTSTRC